jgi:hypothetical protein
MLFDMILALALALQAVSAPNAPRQPLDVRRLTLSQPASIADVDLAALEGQPSRLAWSPDGRQIYLRMSRSDRWGNQRDWHYIVDLSKHRLEAVPASPEWFGMYWAWKAAFAAPGMPDFKIDVETRRERKSPVNVLGGGGLAGNGGDPTLGSELGPQGQAIAQSAMQSQMVETTTFRLKRELLGEFVNTPPVAGLTFGWAPAGSGAIAIVPANKRLVLVDRTGHRREVPGAKDALLPAWSPDATRLAWLERVNKKRAVVVAVDLSAK